MTNRIRRFIARVALAVALLAGVAEASVSTVHAAPHAVHSSASDSPEVP